MVDMHHLHALQSQGCPEVLALQQLQEVEAVGVAAKETQAGMSISVCSLESLQLAAWL